MELSTLQTQLIKKFTNLHKLPYDAVSIRQNGKLTQKQDTQNIVITPRKDGAGLSIYIKNSTKNKSLHIPVLITEAGLCEDVLNEFVIEDNCDILIVAGCEIHTNNGTSQHNSLHHFKIGKNCKIQYIEQHLGLGKTAEKILSPTTKIELGQNSTFEMDTTQIGGVSYANRTTSAKIEENASLLIKENIFTTKSEITTSTFIVNLDGQNSNVQVSSRSVANGQSTQKFASTIIGNNKCYGRVECDGIVLENAKISSCPSVDANHSEASLHHEAQIGKIAGEQLIKLMSLGLTPKQAEEQIIAGFLKN